MGRRHFALCVAAGFAFVVAGCGGGGHSTQVTAQPAPPPTAQASAQTSPTDVQQGVQSAYQKVLDANASANGLDPSTARISGVSCTKITDTIFDCRIDATTTVGDVSLQYHVTLDGRRCFSADPLEPPSAPRLSGCLS